MCSFLSKGHLDIIFEEGECSMEERISKIHAELDAPHSINLNKEFKRRFGVEYNEQRSDAADEAWHETFIGFGFDIETPSGWRANELYNVSGDFYKECEILIKKKIKAIDEDISYNRAEYEMRIIGDIIREELNKNR